ncbi:VOC family protein [Kitasatospora sp. GP82]|uniref:VOC family protein n=1 Tax=Kitasatospora sp. GP82 TaxID=3035089 RepID=UPI0024752293|nr:VOC family protein [Kitasatospora sp. GP82]MDH6129707.1 catechol 2,3-dioxygenase-like lactoylglutathione lyase family enzyme [Kitasatospora sp. GP82]
MTADIIDLQLAIRIARPVLDLDASEDFYVRGLGLALLGRVAGDPAAGERDLLMVGPSGGFWHLELTASSTDPVQPTPTPEDLLVVYLGRSAPEEAIARAVRHGGTVVASHNPYWDRWGITLADPDGYRVVLTERTWKS